MWHFKKAQIKERRISASPLFFLVLILFAQSEQRTLLGQILLAAAIHEAAHIGMLYALGGKIETFRLTPFGGELHIQQSECVPYKVEIAAISAGPMSNLLCAVILSRIALYCGWEEGYLYAGIHTVLGVFNLLPIRFLDGGRILYLLLSWMYEPITADRVLHILSCTALSVLLLSVSFLLGFDGAVFPIVLLEIWCILCWNLETGIVKVREKR